MLRTWLVLGRVSNLPTVWSNVLAAWLLGGGGMPGRLLAVLGAASGVYVAGMFLNDACDADFDRQHRNERPIPMGWVPEWKVWVVGGLLLVASLCVLAELGRMTAWLALALGGAVMLYDFAHKNVPLSPVLMALCRFLLFLVAGSAAADGVTGDVMWSALVLGLYVVGLSYVARRESTGGSLRLWPLPGLAAPVVLAGFLNPPSDWVSIPVGLPVILLVVWTARCVSCLRAGTPAGSRRAVSGLLAGIVWVDALAVVAPPWPWGLVFVALFAMALILQRRVPAT